MSNWLRSNKFISSLLISAGILVIGFLVNHNRITFVALAIFLFAIDVNNHLLKSKPSVLYNVLKAIIVFYIAGDLGYNFYLQTYAPVDGDFVRHILPEKSMEKIFTDPFGYDALVKHERYEGCGRFVGHWVQYEFFNTVPFLFQRVASPISSIFLACALFKILAKVFFIYIFSAYTTGKYSIFSKDFLIAAILVTPIMQTCGFAWSIGIIDPDIMGVGYALNEELLLLFFLPFFMQYYHKRPLKMHAPLIILLLLISVAMAFYGPISIFTLIICPLILLYEWWQNMKKNHSQESFLQKAISSVKQISRPVLLVFIFAMVVIIYAYYISTFNIENFIVTPPLWQRYLKIPQGLYSMYFNKGFGLLAFLLLVNIIILVYRRKDPQARRTLALLVIVILFSIVYTAALPLGGYRPYRPYTVRRDTMVPVTVAIFLFYCVSTFYIMNTIKIQGYRKIYDAAIAIVLLYFVATIGTNKFDNSCQRRSLEELAASKDKIVHLDTDCPLFNWEAITDYRESKATTDLLRRYRVINEEKYFDQK